MSGKRRGLKWKTGIEPRWREVDVTGHIADLHATITGFLVDVP
ncbi:MAG TPA: hypothetical protein VN493_25545 [Thermoanaerobaculia bacterium]|nr:hypothetical protein [Thermoanaerobaculia bacterium]